MVDTELLAAFGPLSQVARSLIEKISEAITGFAKPWQTRRVARAEADAKIILAKADVEVDEISARATVRLFREAQFHQSNIEAVIGAALPLLLEAANPANMDNDWISNFFTKCRIASNEEMQSFWASILAGEANKPGSFSRRTVAVMSELDKNEARQFELVCSIAAKISTVEGDSSPFFIEAQPLVLGPFAFYENLGLYSSIFGDLDTAGLLEYTNIGFGPRGEHPSFSIEHNGGRLHISGMSERKLPLMLGRVSFSKAGKELAPICHVKPADGLLEHLEQAWIAEGFKRLP